MNILALDTQTTDLLKNPENKTEMKFVNFGTKNRKLAITIECECQGNILVSDYGQSVLCLILSEDQKNIVGELEDEIENHVPEGFTYRSFVRDDKFFLKLPIKDGKYKMITVPPQNADEPENSSFASGVFVSIECKPGAYFNFKEKTSGLYLQTSKITIGKKTRKR